MFSTYRKLVAGALVLSGCILGCTPVNQNGGQGNPNSNFQPLAREEFDQVLIVSVDKSASFRQSFRPGGPGFEFTNRLIDQSFRGRAGQNDFLVLSQISGSRLALAWQGPPRQLMNDFVDLKMFDEILDKDAPPGSRVFDGLSETLEIAMTDPAIWNGRTKVMLIGITDMECSLVDSFSSEQRLMKNLKAFAAKGGVIGLYFVKSTYVVQWREKLQNCGFKQFIVEPAETSNPPLPRFE